MNDIEKFAPLDKSWVIRCLCMDIFHGVTDGYKVLETQLVSHDISRAIDAAQSWKTSSTINVGESATLLRFLRYISWITATPKDFIAEGTLLTREVTNDPTIISLSLADLLTLDKGTSQWASIAYICGKRDNIPSNIPYKLKVTIEACNHWENNTPWLPRRDKTILGQIKSFDSVMRSGRYHWIPEQSEDYCFARTFGYMTPEEGLVRWHSLVNHESNRIEEMESAIKQFETTGDITSKDHRVVQALVMCGILHGIKFNCKYPKVVNKSWPQFWNFVSQYEK